MSIILDGKKLAQKIKTGLKNEIEKLTTKPKIAVILVGENPASQIYVKNKQKMAEEIGIDSLILTLPNDITEDNLIEHIHILNEDKEINAILVQLPLPEQINTDRILEVIDPLKDVDGFHPLNSGKLLSGKKPYAIPCTPKGIIRLLKEYDIKLEGINALVLGRSNIVGKPISLLLQKENATVTMAHSKTKNIKEHTKNAELIISAIGKANYITEDMVKNDAIIVDVGISRIENKLYGDVDFDKIKDKASFITPVPGGVGPMTIAMLMENTLELYKLQNHYNDK